VEKKECPTCRTPIGSRRLLRKDGKLSEIIERLIPHLEDYMAYEQEDVYRNIEFINKSEKYKQQNIEMQKIKERQIRAELEEKKDHKSLKSRMHATRRAETRSRPMPRQRTPPPDKEYRQLKRTKTTEVVHEHEHEINTKFKIKQLSSMSSYPWNPKAGERIIQIMMLETNDKLCLKHLTKFVKLKANREDLEDSAISYFVRGRHDRSQFDKLNSEDISLKELKEAYWCDTNKPQSIYFMI
jgi:hypothetical protein